eukprot:365452-Chlamydomonas_euryale.AAC.15
MGAGVEGCVTRSDPAGLSLDTGRTEKLIVHPSASQVDRNKGKGTDAVCHAHARKRHGSLVSEWRGWQRIVTCLRVVAGRVLATLGRPFFTGTCLLYSAGEQWQSSRALGVGDLDDVVAGCLLL